MENLPITTNNRIEILLVIDTDSIVTNYPKKSSKKSLPLSVNKVPPYIFCSGATAIKSNQGDQFVSIIASHGDIIQFRATSVYQNSADAVIIYRVLSKGEPPFTPQSTVLEGAVQPDPDSITCDGLPALHAPETFMSLDSVIVSPGNKKYRVCFALYRLGSDGETQELYGYYFFNLQLSIN